MMDLVYVVQMLRDNSSAMGSPLAVFSEADKAGHFVSENYKHEFVEINESLGYIYENGYGQRIVISAEVVR